MDIIVCQQAIMYILFTKHGTDLNHPDKLIVEYEGRYFERSAHTDWDEMPASEVSQLLSGTDDRYYAIEEAAFHKILSAWGGSANGYRRLNVNHQVKTSSYGDSYDEEDEA